MECYIVYSGDETVHLPRSKVNKVLSFRPPTWSSSPSCDDLTGIVYKNVSGPHTSWLIKHKTGSQWHRRQKLRQFRLVLLPN